MRLVTSVVVAVFGGLALYKGAACVWPHSCTEIGCGDGVSLELAFADHLWPDGAYEIEVALDDVEHVCTFSWPEAAPERGSVRSVGCEPSTLGASISQETDCTGTDQGNVSLPCRPLVGLYGLHLAAPGTPKRLQLRATRDGELLTEQALDLVYSVDQPNGPDCGPVCRESSHALQLD